MVLSRVKELNLELSDADARKLTEKFIDDANDVSGDIVLRAAKRGRNASELMGVVLSRYMIRTELARSGFEPPTSWLETKRSATISVPVNC